MKIIKTTIPKNSLVENAFRLVDYKDSYTCNFQCARQIEVDDLIYAFCNSPSKLIRSLFIVRNHIVRLFKITYATNFKIEKQVNVIEAGSENSKGLFNVLDRTDNEILMGEDDKHLNYRISFFLNRDDNKVKNYSLIISTIVLINNRLGKIYFFLVKPFHKWIVPDIMKRMMKKLNLSSLVI